MTYYKRYAKIHSKHDILNYLHGHIRHSKSATTSSTGGLILALKRAFLLLAQKGGIASAFTSPL